MKVARDVHKERWLGTFDNPPRLDPDAQARLLLGEHGSDALLVAAQFVDQVPHDEVEKRSFWLEVVSILKEWEIPAGRA